MIRNLLLQLCITSAVCSAVLSVSPDTSMKKYVRLSCALCVLSMIISFLPFVSMPDINGAEETRIADLTEETAQMIRLGTLSRLEDTAKEAICKKHNVSDGDATVEISYFTDGGEVVLDKATVTLNGLKYATKVTAVKSTVSELLGCSCEVIINE